jgi:hypothetical protein
MPPSWGAGALLHPGRRPIAADPPLAHRELVFESDGVALRGWLFPAAADGPGRGTTVVYLHGVGDNRASGVWIAERLVRRGFDVLAYDSRAHGASGGDGCTYGFHERRDLSRALDAAGARRVVALGVSLGGAVALQAAPDEPRVAAVVAVAAFSDLEAIARDRAPAFASDGQIRAALAIAEREGRFRVAEVSQLAAARRLRVPVLLVHGEEDRETRPIHSRRILEALGGRGRLRLVAGTGHDDALGRAWAEVESFVVQNGRPGTAPVRAGSPPASPPPPRSR